MIPPSHQPIADQRRYADTVTGIFATVTRSVNAALRDPKSEESRYLNAPTYNPKGPTNPAPAV